MSLLDVLRKRAEALEARRQELEVGLGERVGKPDYPRITREYGAVSKQLEMWSGYESLAHELEETRALVEGDDEEMKELAVEELPDLEQRFETA